MDRTADPRELARESTYTQFNILCPSSPIEFISADEFNKFPPQAQEVILDAFKNEQQHRRQWMSVQQSNDHELNKSQQRGALVLRGWGLIAAVVLVLGSFLCGTWLIYIGKGLWGFGFFIGSTAMLIGTAVYGHKARSVSARVSANKEQFSDTPQLMEG